MRVKSLFSKACILLILIANAKFLSIPGTYALFGSVAHYYSKLLVCACIMVVFVYECIVKDHFRIAMNPISILAVCYLILVACVLVYSILKYPEQSVIRLIRRYYYHIAVLFVFPLMAFMKRPENREWFVRTIVIIGLIYGAYTVGVKLIYSLSGKLLIDTEMQHIQFRNGGLRLARSATFISLSSVIAFAEYLKHRHCLKHKILNVYLLSFVFGALNLLYVSQTRVNQAALIIACFVMLMVIYPMRIKLCIVGLLTCLIPVIIPIVRSFLQSFFSSDNLAGTQIRFDGYAYFLSHMFDGGLIGMGLIVSPELEKLLYRPNESYYVSDLGYIGFLGVYGVLGLIFLVALFAVFVSILWRAVKQRQLRNYPDAIGYLVYFAITGLSLMFSDVQRCLYLPIYLILFWMIDKQLKSKTERIIND